MTTPPEEPMTVYGHGAGSRAGSMTVEPRADDTQSGLSAAEQIERKIDWIVRELDELCAMANHPETVDLVDSQRVGVGQIITRANLIGAFLMNRKKVINSG